MKDKLLKTGSAYWNARKGKRILNHAIEHLRPLAMGDTQKGITPNGEALAISTLVKAMIQVWGAGK